MNRTEKKKILKRNLAASLLLIFIIGFSIAGATQAWFTSGADLVNVFTAGTVVLEKPGEPAFGSESFVVDESSVECKTVTWKIKSTGTKNAYVRVKPTAELIQVNSVPIYIALKVNIKSNNNDDSLLLYETEVVTSNQYIKYYAGTGTEIEPIVGFLLSKGNGNLFSGSQVHIWDAEVDGVRRLFVKIVSIGTPPPGYQPYNLFFYAGLDNNFNYSGNYWNGYPIRYLNENPYNEILTLDNNYDYTVKEPLMINGVYNFNRQGVNDGLPFVFTAIGNNTIVSLSELYNNQETILQLEPELCTSSVGNWLKGKGNDDWWYYGTESGPTKLPPEGGEVYVCFKYCEALNSGSTLKVSLEAEAIQWSNSAIDYKWVIWDGGQLIGSHPWYIWP